MAEAREWDASTYDRVSDPQERWGSTVLDRLPLAGDETVLDAGCGSGRVTRQLLERLPRGRAVALDASAEMLRQARERLGEAEGRVEFVRADLSRPLPLANASMDSVLSTATFHWIADHGALFRHLSVVMKPGARLVAQCGGAGNIASVVAALADLGATTEGWTFADPGETAQRLEAAGFEDIEVWLNDEPTTIPAGDFETYLATVILGAQLERIPTGDRPGFVREVARRLPGHELDYVRLNICATLGAGGGPAGDDC